MRSGLLCCRDQIEVLMSAIRFVLAAYLVQLRTHSVDTVAGDDVRGARRGTTDRGARGVDINAVAVVGHGGGAGRVGADQVALDQARRVDVDAVPVLPEMILAAPEVVPPIVAPEAPT